VAAWRDDPVIAARATRYLLFAVYAAAMLGLLGMILWRLWTEVLGAWPT
jgi:hypothetical protein